MAMGDEGDGGVDSILIPGEAAFSYLPTGGGRLPPVAANTSCDPCFEGNYLFGAGVAVFMLFITVS